jgi:hypothetical protein
MLCKGNYEQALGYIYDNYSSVRVVSKSWVEFSRFTSAKTEALATTDRVVYGKNKISYNTLFLDKVANGLYSINFLVQSLYHEFIHVMQYRGINGLTDTGVEGVDEIFPFTSQLFNKSLPVLPQSETDLLVRSLINRYANAEDATIDGNYMKRNIENIKKVLDLASHETRSQLIESLRKARQLIIK